MMKGENLKARLLYPARISFRFNTESKSSTEKQMRREFSITKPALQQMLKELLQAGNTREGKDLRKKNPKQLRKLYQDHQFSSVTQSCPTLCDCVDCSTPGLAVCHQLLEFTQTHVIGDAIQPPNPLSTPFPPTFSLSQHQGLSQ